jgi:hypothetical protein
VRDFVIEHCAVLAVIGLGAASQFALLLVVGRP